MKIDEIRFNFLLDLQILKKQGYICKYIVSFFFPFLPLRPWERRASKSGRSGLFCIHKTLHYFSVRFIEEVQTFSLVNFGLWRIKPRTFSSGSESDETFEKMPVMEKLKMFVVQEPVVAASCLIGGIGT